MSFQSVCHALGYARALIQEQYLTLQLELSRRPRVSGFSPKRGIRSSRIESCPRLHTHWNLISFPELNRIYIQVIRRSSRSIDYIVPLRVNVSPLMGSSAKIKVAKHLPGFLCCSTEPNPSSATINYIVINMR
jgi:hypothetical protein